MRKDIFRGIKLPRRTERKLVQALMLIAVTSVIILLVLAISTKGTSNTVEVPSDELPFSAIPQERVWEPEREDVEALAKALYGECRGVESTMERAAVAWCVLNRVDSSAYPDTVLEVLTQPHQFQGYADDAPVLPGLAELAEDVLTRWHRERGGAQDCGRVLPQTYIYFVGDGKRNYFTEEFLGKDVWDFSLPNPYED